MLKVDDSKLIRLSPVTDKEYRNAMQTLARGLWERSREFDRYPYLPHIEYVIRDTFVEECRKQKCVTLVLEVHSFSELPPIAEDGHTYSTRPAISIRSGGEIFHGDPLYMYEGQKDGKLVIDMKDVEITSSAPL